ncbi:MAG: hypothetical protein JXA03_01365 [Bacteroidales bacterium]|nr:hypothetical protein [Bacteroidales bacterium]
MLPNAVWINVILIKGFSAHSGRSDNGHFKDNDTVDIEYKAYHPETSHNFLHHYTMSVKRGISGTGVGSLYETIPAPVPAVKSFVVKDLLGLYDRCAFAVWLHTFPRTRDGHSAIRAYEASDSSAFALLKK